MNKALLLIADDWEGLYVNGQLIEEGHTLNQGYSRTKYFIKLSNLHRFDLNDLEEDELTDEEDGILDAMGGFPEKLIDFRPLEQ